MGVEVLVMGLVGSGQHEHGLHFCSHNSFCLSDLVRGWDVSITGNDNGPIPD